MAVGLRPVHRSVTECQWLRLHHIDLVGRRSFRTVSTSSWKRIRPRQPLLCLAHKDHDTNDHCNSDHDSQSHSHDTNGSSASCCSIDIGHHHESHVDESNPIHCVLRTIFNGTGLTPLARWLDTSKPSSAAKIVLFIIAASASCWAHRAVDVAAGEAWRRLAAVSTAGVYFFAGIPAAIELAFDVSALRVDTHALMNLAVVGTLVTGMPLEGALLLVLFQTSHAVEHMLTERAQGSLQALHDAVPDHAELVTLGDDGAPNLGSVRRVLAADVAVGDTVLVKPGRQIPIDGVIVYGRALVSAEHITGESLPNLRRPGDEIPAGALCHDGFLAVRAIRPATDSTPARIARLARDAQMQRPQIRTWLDRFGEVYSRIVVLAAGASLLVMLASGVPLSGSGPERGAFYRAMTLLTVASPCALVMVPLAYISAIAAAASRGVLLKGGRVLDALEGCKVVAVDKTGTLTTGKLALVNLIEINTSNSSLLNSSDSSDGLIQSSEEDLDDVLAASVALSLRSAHPVSDAVVQVGDARGVDASSVKVLNFKLVPGGGVSGAIQQSNDGILYDALFGSLDFVASELSQEEHGMITAHRTARGRRNILSILILRPIDGRPHIVWMFLFEDSLQSLSMSAVQALQSGAWAGDVPSVHHQCDVVMLTGDNHESANQVAGQLGIRKVFSGLSPEEKLHRVDSLRDTAGGSGVVMVGDGLNDAAALVAADVGVAIASPTTAAATLAADAVLMRGAAGIAAVPLLLRIARATRHVVRQNLVLAGVSIMALALPAVLGIIPLWIAVVLHEGSTLLVALNSLRLLRFSAKFQGRKVAALAKTAPTREDWATGKIETRALA